MLLDFKELITIEIIWPRWIDLNFVLYIATPYIIPIDESHRVSNVTANDSIWFASMQLTVDRGVKHIKFNERIC